MLGLLPYFIFKQNRQIQNNTWNVESPIFYFRGNFVPQPLLKIGTPSVFRKIMIFNPLPSVPSIPPSPLLSFFSFGVNLVFDGVVFFVVLALNRRFIKRTDKITNINDANYSPSPPDFTKMEIFIRILLHVFVGYGADFFGGSLRYYDYRAINWLIFAATLGLFQGVALKITLHKIRSPRSIPLWVGVILFSVGTNPYTFRSFLPVFSL